MSFLLRGQLTFFQAQGFEVFAISSDGPERNQFEREGITHFVVPMTRKVSILQDIKCVVQLIRLIRRYRPDIVHTHTPKAGFVGMIAAWICRVPGRLHTVAGLPLMESRGLARLVFAMAERITAACATMVYPNSIGLMNYIRSNVGIPTEKLRVIGKGSSNGIDLSVFRITPELKHQAREIRNRYQIHQDEIVFIFIGRLVRSKGLHELVAAFRKVCDRNSKRSFRLLCLGYFEPDLDPLDEATLLFLKNDRRVILAGFQNDVRPWLLASDILVFPSYREGFPNVVMQACCMEVACVVSDINGCNEIIQHNESGLVVKPRDVEALSFAMETLANRRDLRRVFASCARVHVEKNFDQRSVWRGILAEYRSTLEGKRSD